MASDPADSDMVDVAVVGCGPVGAFAANLLGQAGLRVLAIEREVDPFPLPRAVHLDHEMMRLFQSIGLADALAADMRDTDGHLHIGADGGVIRYLGTVGRPRPFGWSNDYFFYQPELEATLRGALARWPGVELALGTELDGLMQDEHGVTLSLRSAAGALQARARWVIGCDGARSTVRRALGIALDDLRFEEPWLVVDVEADGPVTFPPLTGVPADADLQKLSVMMCDPRRPATVVPGRRDHRRWEFMLLPGEDDAAMMRPASVAALVEPWLAGVPHRIVRAATYRFHGLVAKRWQAGRVFLAGDAAHQTPPFFGQGMCHGLRDVANLGWKLAHVVRGLASPALLDSYQVERDPHVRAVITAAVEAGRYICMLEPAEAAARDAAMRERARSQAAPATAADLIPAIGEGVVAPGGAGAGERFVQPRLDDGRLLDEATGTGWRLFVADAALAAPARSTADDLLPDLSVEVIEVSALLPVIPDPAKILCVGHNYESHRQETGRAKVDNPSIFTRFADTLVAAGDAIVLPRVSTMLDYEAELAIVIGKGGRAIAAEDALGHVAGYACFNDASVRDWQWHTSQFTPGKNFPGTGAFGPCLVTPDEAGDLSDVHVVARLNGTVMQDQPVRDMIFPIPTIIAYVSAFTQLSPGDVIATGTPGGVGAKRQPPVWMAAGDTIEVEIGTIGTLTNTIAAVG